MTVNKEPLVCLENCRQSYAPAMPSGQLEYYTDDMTDTTAMMAVSASGGLVVTIRGTESLTDVMHDLMIWKTKLRLPNCEGAVYVHAGFLRCAMSVLDPLRKWVLKQKQGGCSDGRMRSCTFTGHSLGGAVASILALIIKPSIDEHFDVDVITFGAPRIGDSVFARHYNRTVPNHTRYVMYRDPIPYMPSLFYRHVGEAVPIGSMCGYVSSHKLQSYEDALELMADDTCGVVQQARFTAAGADNPITTEPRTLCDFAAAASSAVNSPLPVPSSIGPL